MGNACGTPVGDGYVTARRTFQKYYDQHELRDWLESSLSVSCVPAAPGVVYVFRDPRNRESFVAARYRSRTTTPRVRKSDVLFKQHVALLEPLIDFVTRRGRLPEPSELATADRVQAALGSIQQAFHIVRRVTGREQWEEIRRARSGRLALVSGARPFRHASDLLPTSS